MPHGARSAARWLLEPWGPYSSLPSKALVPSPGLAMQFGFGGLLQFRDHADSG